MRPTKRPEPLAIRNAAAFAAQIIALIIAALGFDLTDEQLAFAATTIIAVGQGVATYAARRVVTPLEDPVDADGTRLIPIE